MKNFAEVEISFLILLKNNYANDNNSEDKETHEEHVEARRLAKERYFFARNPNLVKRAKEIKGYKCQICNFDFYNIYGEIGDKFIEAHHMEPISERAEAEWSEEIRTSTSRIAVLCSNCHRMIHRRRPAIEIEELERIYIRKGARK